MECLFTAMYRYTAHDIIITTIHQCHIPKTPNNTSYSYNVYIVYKHYNNTVPVGMYRCEIRSPPEVDFTV